MDRDRLRRLDIVNFTRNIQTRDRLTHGREHRRRAIAYVIDVILCVNKRVYFVTSITMTLTLDRDLDIDKM